MADLLPHIPDTQDSIEAQVARQQMQKILADALVRLDPNQREVLLLRDVEGLTAPEAADRLAITVQALKSRLHRARDQLRMLVGDLYPIA